MREPSCEGSSTQNLLIPTRRTKLIQAVAVLVASPSADSGEYKQQLSERYGFKQIGEPLHENVTMRDIIDTLPGKVFEIGEEKAWKLVSISVNSYALGLFLHDLKGPVVSTSFGLGLDRD